MENNYPYRWIARIELEAKTPIKVGAGKADFASDSVVLKDINGLPYIPGTSIIGVLRHALEDALTDENEKEKVNEIFGFQDAAGGQGSTLICSSALLIGPNEKVLDGLSAVDWENDFYKLFVNLPVRQHVCINDKGCASDTGKFDEEVVYKGTRFRFELELVAKEESTIQYVEEKIFPLMKSPLFRLGGGTRKGFGELGVHSIQKRTYHLTKPSDLKDYLEKSSSLAEAWTVKTESDENSQELLLSWKKSVLKLKIKDFILFGSGFGDDEADMTPVEETVIDYENPLSPTSKSQLIAPATSIKGALAHRTRFYYNKLNGIYADADKGERDASGKELENLFGSADPENPKRGNLIISDVFFKKNNPKVFTHVAIDRYTGGAIDGALFNEKTFCVMGKFMTITILWNANGLSDKVRDAFEAALYDLKNGYLPLGGSTNRGHGVVSGEEIERRN